MLRRAFLACLALGMGLAAPGSVPVAGQLWSDPVSGMEFVYCPPATFQMGSPSSDPYRAADQEPQHAVTLSRGFWLGRTEVTQAQWKARMGSNPSRFKGDTRPVEKVTWNDCQAFLQTLNKAAGGNHYRLPTEAEWEYACAAGVPEDKEGDLNLLAWYKLNSEGGTKPVGQKQPNAWGLFDMLGNVREWCSDWRGPYAPGAATDPQGAKTGTYRINRGGSWFCNPAFLRRVYRWHYTPDFQDDDLGFRVVRVVE